MALDALVVFLSCYLLGLCDSSVCVQKRQCEVFLHSDVVRSLPAEIPLWWEAHIRT